MSFEQKNNCWRAVWDSVRTLLSQSVRSQCWSSFSPTEAHCGEQAVWGSSKSWVNGLILMLLSLCVLTALCTGSSGGQWEDLYWSDPLHWEKSLWGDTADQRSGKAWSESSWRTTEETGAGDWRSEEEKRWAGAAFTHRQSHPFPPGNRDLTNRRVVFRKGKACCTEIVFLSNVSVFSWCFSCVFVSVAFPVSICSSWIYRLTQHHCQFSSLFWWCWKICV